MAKWCIFSLSHYFYRHSKWTLDLRTQNIHDIKFTHTNGLGNQFNQNSSINQITSNCKKLNWYFHYVPFSLCVKQSQWNFNGNPLDHNFSMLYIWCTYENWIWHLSFWCTTGAFIIIRPCSPIIIHLITCSRSIKRMMFLKINLTECGTCMRPHTEH